MRDLPHPKPAGGRKLWALLLFAALVRLIVYLSEDNPVPLPTVVTSKPINRRAGRADNADRMLAAVESLGLLNQALSEGNRTPGTYTNQLGGIIKRDVHLAALALKSRADKGDLKARRDFTLVRIFRRDSHHDFATVATTIPAGQVSQARVALLEFGRTASKKFCVACHKYPEPKIYPRGIWAFEVLPAMAEHLGMRKPEADDRPGWQRVLQSALMPHHPLVSIEEWVAINYFYLNQAPREMPASPDPPALHPAPSFLKASRPALPFGADVSLIHIDSARRAILVGTDSPRAIHRLDASGRLLASLDLGNTPVSLATSDKGMLLTAIGSFFPSDIPTGEVLQITGPDWNATRPVKHLTKLQRPTDTARADLNGDHRPDLVVSEYGHNLGRLAWWENTGNHKYVPHDLIPRAGAINVRLHDFNRDGRQDIIALMAAGRESVSLFLNQGNGTFQEQLQLERHPAWGYSHLELADFNGDGHPDLLITNGDNGDLNLEPLKPWHGVRIHLNDGHGQFGEDYFFPQHGAYRARAADFDLDGDLDIVSIAYFPDFKNHPRESAVYLENLGNLRFRAHELPGHNAGRWITLDLGDLDADGDPDIVLGAYNRGPAEVPASFKERWEKSPAPILILKNTTR